MLDLSDTIVPKSDQLNGDDLRSGSRTFTITEVRKTNSDEQPVSIGLQEFPGRPWKPSKSMRRVLVEVWGRDASEYAGKRITLYRDDKIRFGGQEVGGIRVSHMSGLKKPKQMALHVTRGKYDSITVQPLADEPSPAEINGPTEKELDDLGDGLIRLGIKGGPAMLAQVVQIIERPVKSPRELRRAEVATVLDWIKHEEAADTEPTLPGGCDLCLPGDPCKSHSGR